MYKKSILALAIAITSFTATSQNAPTGYLSLNTGVALPVGSFRNHYALNGSVTNISFGLPLSSSGWGISSSIGMCYNSFDARAYTTRFASNAAYSYSVKSYSGYATNSLMFGSLYTIPTKKFSFDFTMQAGLLFSTSPTIKINVTDNMGNVAAAGMQGVGATSFAFKIGAGARYNLFPKFAFFANINWLSGTASYKNVLVTNYTQDQYGALVTNKEYINFNQHISLLNFTAGVAWQFATSASQKNK